jgi:atypical dual specificity phosphatase
MKCYIPILMTFSARTGFVSAAALLMMGCGGAESPPAESDSVPTVSSSVAETRPIAPSQGFSWIVQGELAAMPLPGRDRPLEQDVAYLDQEGIRVLVSLTDDPPDGTVLESRGIDQEHIPVQDFTPPTLEQMIEFVGVVENSVAADKPVGVHCTAGLGRSGTMAAAYLVAEGASAAEAIVTVRQLRPGSIETATQEDAVRRFEEHLASDR